MNISYLILNKKYSYSVNLVLILYSNLGIRENTGKCAVAVRSLTNLLFDHFLGLVWNLGMFKLASSSASERRNC